MGPAALVAGIIADWPAIHASARAKGYAHPARIKPGLRSRLLGRSRKVRKGEGLGVLTSVVYMAPADESGVNLCPWATQACKASCIGTSTGQLATPDAKRARLWKTALYLGDRKRFVALLCAEIEAHERAAERLGMVPSVRVNGSSDIELGARLAGRFPGVRFYDYTKSVKRALAYVDSSYRVTFSYTGHNLDDALRVLRAGGNVAVVFDADPRTHEPIPESWHGFPVLDGDDSDVRFKDPPGHVVGLRFKRAAQRAEHMASAIRDGFAVPVGALLRKAA